MSSFGLLGSHLALGTTVLIGIAAAEYSGAKILLAIPLAAFTITSSALCVHPERKNDEKYRKRKCCDILDFLEIWFEILSYLAAAAICARIASVTMDYMSHGRLRELFFGLQADKYEEPWPDIFGVTVIVAITFMFMIGLERSNTLSFILLIGIIFGFMFFVIVGGSHTNVRYKKWEKDFRFHSFESVLTTAAICSFGFANDYYFLEKSKLVTSLLITLIIASIYAVIAIIFTFMSHYRELVTTVIPLIRVFEIRDIGWARPFMAIFTLIVVFLAITEILPSIYKIFLKLASRKWQIFVSSLEYKSNLTGAPILAIFAAGSLAAILAFSCPLSYLISLVNFCTLLSCSLRTSSDLYTRYKPTSFQIEQCEINTNIQYSKLNIPKNRTSRCHSLIKGILHYAKSSSNETRSYKKTNTEIEDDNECLLLDNYKQSKNFQYADYESDLSESSPENDSGDDSSSTDVDAAVQEYIDRVQVATVDNFDSNDQPTTASARTVIFVISLLFAVVIFMSICIYLEFLHTFWSLTLILPVVYCILLKLPQNENEKIKRHLVSPRIFAILAPTAILLNAFLASTLIVTIWHGILFWILSGMLLFWRCECCTCEGLIQQPGEMSYHIIDHMFPQSKEKVVDTIFIAR